jgi:hypothetical protein
MTPTKGPRSSDGGGRRWGAWVGLAVLALAVVYVVILPLLRPRGSLLWGHYRLLDIYAGVPLTLVALCFVVVLATPARRRRAVALRATAVAMALIVSLFVFDFAYTIAQPRFRQPDFWFDGGRIERAHSTSHPELGFVRKPLLSYERPAGTYPRATSYRTDENGFRNPPQVTSADVVFIGDSFTESGYTPEESTFVRRAAAETGLRTVNLGRGAYGPQQELIVLERYGLSYKPRFVVWQLFEGNDLLDAVNFAVWRADPRPPALPLKQRYWENSLIHRLVAGTDARNAASTRIPIVVSYRDGTRQRKPLAYRYVPDQVDRHPQGFAETQRALEAGIRLCESHGIHLAIVFIPTLAQVLEPFIAFDGSADRERALPGRLVRSDRDFGSRLKDVCRKPACTYLDAFQALRVQALADNSRVYDRHDPDEHLDVDGHAVVSRLVVDWIRSATTEAGHRRNS